MVASLIDCMVMLLCILLLCCFLIIAGMLLYVLVGAYIVRPIRKKIKETKNEY